MYVTLEVPCTHTNVVETKFRFEWSKQEIEFKKNISKNLYEPQTRLVTTSTIYTAHSNI